MDLANFLPQFAAPFAAMMLSGLLLSLVAGYTIQIYLKKTFDRINFLSNIYQTIQAMHEINGLLVKIDGAENTLLEKEVESKFRMSHLISEKYFNDKKLNKLYTKLYDEGLVKSLIEPKRPMSNSVEIIAEIILRLYKLSDLKK